jgi:hypothetical protein
VKSVGIFTDRYSKPLPGWVSDIKAGAKYKITSSIASQACREGNIPAMRQLLIVFWPFVDEFPKIVRRGCVKFIKHELMSDPGNADDLLSLLVLADKTLTLIERDEADHRELWIQAAEAVGLTYQDLVQSPIPLVNKLITEMETWTYPAAMFLRFAAVEIMAAVSSEHFLESPQFRQAVGTKGSEWFLAHTEHGDESHESLTYRLAFAFRESGITHEEASALIQPLIDLFLEAAESAVTAVA